MEGGMNTCFLEWGQVEYGIRTQLIFREKGFLSFICEQIIHLLFTVFTIGDHSQELLE